MGKKTYISQLIPLIFTPLYIIFVFEGANISFLADNNYDNWRFLQFFLILFTITVSHFFIKNKYFYNLKNKYSFILLLTFPLLITSVYKSKYWSFALLDLSYYIIIIIFIYYLFLIINNTSDNYRHNLMAIVAISPIFIIIWMVLGLLLFYINETPLVWHLGFKNVRYYDDTLLACLFLLWLKPGFLSRYTTIVYILSTCYILSLWLDGARAVLLSISTSLFFVYTFMPQQRKQIKIPLYTIVFSFIIYIIFISTSDATITIARTDSSNRWQIWLESLNIWLENPIFGIGGANFAFLPKWVNYYTAHPHNWIVQMIVEWGLSGIVIVCTSLLLFFKLLKKQIKTSAIYFAGCIAIFIDMLFSGIHVYPQSQVTICFFIALSISEVYKNEDRVNKISKNSNNIIFIIFLFFSLIIIGLNKDNIYRTDIKFEGINNYPRFLQNGKSIITIKNESANIFKKD